MKPGRIKQALSVEGLPGSRAEAKRVGVKHYFDGVICKRNHISPRYASTGQCHECQYLHRINWREKNPEKEAESRLISVRIWAATNPELKREYARRSNAKPEISAKNVKRAKRWQEANPQAAAEARSASDRNRRCRKVNAEGHHTKDDIAELLRKQKYRCTECGASVKKVGNRHVDHIIPLSRGGTNWPRNLQVLCPPCNLRKAAKDPLEFARSKGRLL